MFTLSRLRSILHNATRARVRQGGLTVVPNQQPVPVMAKQRVPLANMPRLGEVDGPTVPLPRVGDPGVNGRRYMSVGRHRAADRNRVPAGFTGRAA